jgi:hypothetical protein
MENVRLREQAFRQGLGTSLDVEDAQSKLAGVLTQRQAAAYLYVVLSGHDCSSLCGRQDEFSHYQQSNRIEVAS